MENMQEPGKAKDEGNAIVGLKIEEEHNEKKDSTEQEKEEAQAVRDDAVRGKDKEEAKEQINGKNLGESSKGNRKNPRKRNRKKKLAQVAAVNGARTDEEHNREATHKEGTLKEASINGEDEEKTEGLKTDDGCNKGKALIEGEKDKAQAAREDSVRGKVEKKTNEQMNGESLGESLKAKGRKPRRRNKKRKLAQKASEMVAWEGDETNAMAAANNGLAVLEGQTKEKALGETGTRKEDAFKEALTKGEDEEKTEEQKNMEKYGKGRKPKKRNKKKKVAQQSSEIVAVDGDKPESSSKKKDSKMVESMGMVFMCSSKTKADCFHYKILGLPAGKKDQVAKIYKGMRLFLFDVDTRLMYGIFKATGAGGYNIEPKAFKSAFPSQVRFTVFADCSPLSEENFRIAIKENYYTRNKFDCHLNAQQVQKLCKLFFAARKGDPAPKKPIKNRQTVAADERTARVPKKRKRPRRDDERQPHSPLGSDPRRHRNYGLALDPGPRYPHHPHRTQVL